MMTKARPALTHYRPDLANLVGFHRQSESEFTRRFSCWILRNRASLAVEQNEAPARGIPGLLRLATRFSGSVATLLIVSYWVMLSNPELGSMLSIGIHVSDVFQKNVTGNAPSSAT
jgi:hypothetical protein